MKVSISLDIDSYVMSDIKVSICLDIKIDFFQDLTELLVYPPPVRILGPPIA
jgi:hypothetical protein